MFDPPPGSPPWLALLLSLGAGAASLVLGLAVRRRRPAPADGPGAIRDILGTELKRSTFSETAGVRWEMALYPETLSVPGYVVVTAIVQNAYDRPRSVTVEIAPGPLLPNGHSCSAALKAGEAGVLRTPIFVSRTTPLGAYSLRAHLVARAPQGEGTRLLPTPVRRSSSPRPVSLEIVSAHNHPPVNLFAYDWKGFTSLYIPPQARPDLTELQILQELPSAPH